MAQSNRKFMDLIEDIRAEQRFVEIVPGQVEVALSCHPADISVIRCEVEGSTVPFEFDGDTGTIDLPQKLQGKTARIYYKYKTRYEADALAVIEDIRIQERERLRSVPTSSPGPKQALVVGRVEGGPYRSSDLVQHVKPEPPPSKWKQRWQRFWFWTASIIARILGWT